MDWTDEGLVIGTRRHGETSVILELMTAAHGRHLGLVRGGRSRRLAAVLQPGNTVSAVWRARLDEHLGTYTVEGLTLRAAALIENRAATYGLQHLAGLLRLLPERDPHPGLYEAAGIVAGALGHAGIAAPLLVRFELALLAELGFGLDLSECAATGATQDLVYVSPKSGRAVSRAAGEAYRDRLFALPGFLHEGGDGTSPTPDDVAAGFALTGHFLARHVFEPRGLGMPEARMAFVAASGEA